MGARGNENERECTMSTQVSYLKFPIFFNFSDIFFNAIFILGVCGTTQWVVIYAESFVSRPVKAD